MTKKLEGKTAVITGGTEGIGLATAKLFVQEGAHVFITGRRQKELDEAVRAIGSNAVGVRGDVAKMTDFDLLYETVGKVKGRIDIIFANAGVGEFVPFGDVSEEHFDKLLNINAKGAFFTVQKGLPLLNDGGSIILTGSVASMKGTAAFGVYAASKAAIRSFVRTWTTDLKDRHIRSNVVSPGPIRTPLVNRQAPDVIARIVSTIPMGRMGEPDEVAKAALYLASDDSSFVTGIELFVDGGQSAGLSGSPRLGEMSMITQQHLASVKRADREIHVREEVLNSAILGADISGGWEDSLEILDAFYAEQVEVSDGTESGAVFGRERVRALLFKFLAPIHVMDEIGCLSVQIRESPIHRDSADETHSAWSLDLIGVSGRTYQISWCSLRRWAGSRVVYERHYYHQRTGWPLIDSDLRVGPTPASASDQRPS